MKQVTAILVGAGQRGADAYASYALNHPGELTFVAVAEPRADRRAAFCAAHNIPESAAFATWDEILKKPRLADCALICTQDNMHFEPVMQALRQGYHVLCEKPMSPDKRELVTMGELARTSGRLFSICHVLRYSPFFVQIKELLCAGAIGQLVAMQHMESVGYWHMAHSFVRGNWRNSAQSCPIILAKCCHDMDILLWLTDSHCTRVESVGALAHFAPKNAPKGAPKYCLDGCPHRDSCPYYAPRFYLEHPRALPDGFAKTVSLDTSPAGLLQALASGPYGRCVYHCDNDVVDNQFVHLEFENGVRASLTLSAFTEKCERVITLMGSTGQIKANMEDGVVELLDFVTGNHTTYTLHTASTGHSGSDEAMMRDFTALVAADGKTASKSGADLSVESHLMSLAAEESRTHGGAPVDLRQFWSET